MTSGTADVEFGLEYGNELLVRRFEEFHVREGDGRTLDGLCVPYDIPATVADPPSYQPYQEMFVKGAFARAVKAPNRVLVDFEHRTGIGNVLGHGIQFEERADGLYGTLRISEHADGDKALALVRNKVLAGLSVGFKALKSRRVDGIVQRLVVHLDRIALVREGSWEQAQVLAVRSAPVLPRAEKINPGLAEDLRHFGINVPEDEDQT